MVYARRMLRGRHGSRWEKVRISFDWAWSLRTVMMATPLHYTCQALAKVALCQALAKVALCQALVKAALSLALAKAALCQALAWCWAAAKAAYCEAIAKAAPRWIRAK